MNKENLRNTFNESVLILMYEFFGTFLMTVLFINYGKLFLVQSPPALLTLYFSVPIAQNSRMGRYANLSNT